MWDQKYSPKQHVTTITFIFNDCILTGLREKVRVMVKVLDCELVGSKFEFQSHYNVHFWFSIHWERYEIPYHHHRHHVVPPARISLTLSRHFSLSFIAFGRSSGLHPVSSHSCCMYVRVGRPAFAWPYAGVHRSTSLMSSSLLLQQYTAYLCVKYYHCCSTTRMALVLNNPQSSLNKEINLSTE